MSDQSTPLPPAGWYADPENAAGERWWNGAMWGEERRPTNAVPPIPVPPVPVPPMTDGPAATASDNPAARAADASAAAAAAPFTPPAMVETRPDPYAAAAPYTTPSAATPYGSPAAAPYAPQYAPAAPNPNTIALVGFIISMASILLNLILTGLVGIAGGIVSAIGLSKANRLARAGVVPNGRGLALAGTIVGFVGGGLTILVWVLIVAISFSASLV